RQQLVVAPATADRQAVRRIVDLEHRARVIAEASDKSQVEDDPLGDLGRQQRVKLAHPADRLLQWSVEGLERIGTAAEVGHAKQEIGVLGAEVKRTNLSLHSHEVADYELAEDLLVELGRDADRVEQLRVERGIPNSDAVTLKPGRVERRAEDGQR